MCKNIDIIAVNYAIRIGWWYEITFRNIAFVYWLYARWDLQSVWMLRQRDHALPLSRNYTRRQGARGNENSTTKISQIF